MKKIISIMLVLSLALALTACGGEIEPETSDNVTEQSTTAVTTEITQTTTTEQTTQTIITEQTTKPTETTTIQPMPIITQPPNPPPTQAPPPPTLPNQRLVTEPPNGTVIVAIDPLWVSPNIGANCHFVDTEVPSNLYA